MGATASCRGLRAELTTTDQIIPEQKAVSPFFPGFWESRGWGFGVSVFTRRATAPARWSRQTK